MLEKPDQFNAQLWKVIRRIGFKLTLQNALLQ